MEDLDSLLEDLGRPKSTSEKKPRAPSSRVDLNELEDLMLDLSSPSNRTSIFSESSPSTPSTGGQSEMDDLDALMDSLNTSSRVSTITMEPVIEPEPVSVAPVSVPETSQSSYFSSSSRESVSNSDNLDDLDDLLSNLTPSTAPPPSNEFKRESFNNFQSNPIHNSQPSGGYSSSNYDSSPAPVQPKPVSGGDLDNLLTNLTSQMDDIDTNNPASRGTCSTCRQSILGEVIQALGKTFHPEHFVCGNCRAPLGTGNFFEQDGRPQCERCYRQLFCPRCAHCDEPILDRCITALGKKWHTDHFICTQCLKPFAGGNFYEKENRPYCEGCFYSVFAPRCASCNQGIQGDCVNALGSQWHAECFVCQYCQKSFGSGTFFEHQGKPYCEQHYHLQTGALCAGCGKSISGRCVTALDKKWHPEHFVCAFCMNPLAGGAYTEQNAKAYCKECHGKLFN